MSNVYRVQTKQNNFTYALNTCLEVLNLVRAHLSDQIELEIKALVNLGWL